MKNIWKPSFSKNRSYCRVRLNSITRSIARRSILYIKYCGNFQKMSAFLSDFRCHRPYLYNKFNIIKSFSLVYWLLIVFCVFLVKQEGLKGPAKRLEFWVLLIGDHIVLRATSNLLLLKKCTKFFCVNTNLKQTPFRLQEDEREILPRYHLNLLGFYPSTLYLLTGLFTDQGYAITGIPVLFY